MIQVRCESLTAIMKESHGSHVILDIDVARKLEHTREIRIISAVNQPLINEDIFKSRFENSTALKVAWVQDYHKDGGAELSNFVVTEIGRNLGHDIVVMTPNNFDVETLLKAQIIIVNNIFEFSEKDYRDLLFVLYSGKIPYVKYEHDHREITERKQQSSRLFFNSAMNVFISPLQRSNHIDAFGGSIAEKCVTLPLAIDTKKFVMLDEVRKGDTVLVPSTQKCLLSTIDFINKNPQYMYTLVGAINPPKADNVRSINFVSVNAMPKLYNQHEIVLHLPEKVGGGERVIFEAVLCGCKVITNDNSAHTTWSNSFNWRDASVLDEQLKKAPYEFWKRVEACIQKQ